MYQRLTKTDMNKLLFTFQQSEEFDIEIGSLIPKSEEFIEIQENKGVDKIFKLKPSFFSKDKKVEDCHRFTAEMVGKELKIVKLDEDKPIGVKVNPRIIILLESPHKDEYDTDFNPIRPANGITGCYLLCFLPHEDVLPRLIKEKGLELMPNTTYDVLLVNPVQYQASLAFVFDNKMNEKVRDKVWSKLFGVLKQDFEQRIKSYEPDVILNFCTTKAGKAVQKCINSVFAESLGVQLFKGPHPSSWFNQNNCLSIDRIR